ncbi:MAG: hypothetical protein ACLFNO_03345 [Parcubacteria group bacterium]
MKTKLSDLQNLLSVIEAKNLSVFDASKIITATKTNLDDKEFNLTVDYSRTLKEMIKFGNYDYFDKKINENNFPFPVDFLGKKIKIYAKLLHFNEVIRGQEIIDRLNKTEASFRPATLAEQLSFAQANPELQKDFPIVALGSIYRNIFRSLSVPVLFFDDYKRQLSLDWFESKWSPFCRFLIVHK